MVVNRVKKELLLRVVVAGIALFGALVLSEVVTPQQFGEITVLIFLIKSSTGLNLGISQGLLYYIFKNKVNQYFATVVNRVKKELLLRAVVAGIALFGTLALSEVVTPQQFGEITFFIFLIKSSTSLNLGINQGLLYYIFKNKVNQYFATYIITYAVFMIIVAIGYGYFGVNISILLLIVAPLLLVEPYLKTEKHYYFNYIPEIVCLIATFGSIYIFDVHASNIERARPFQLIAVSSVVLVFWLIRGDVSNLYNKSIKTFDIRLMVDLLKKGQGAYYFGLLFVLYLFIDRRYVETIYGAELLGTMMLVYTLIGGSQFIVTILNSAAIVELGEEIKKGKSIRGEVVRSRLKQSFVISVSSYIFSGCVLYFLSKNFFLEYPSIVETYFIIGLAVSSLNIYTSISPVLFFYHKSSVSVYGFILVIVFLIMNYNLMSNGYLLTILLNSLFFSLIMLVLVYYVCRLVRNN